MKKSRLLTNKIIAALLLGSLFLPQEARCGEFVIINTTFAYTVDNGGMFACHVSPPFNSSIPTNWMYPDDYWNGHFYGYYEVLDVPTSEPFGFQMGIFQYIYPNDGKNFKETCSLIIPQLNGVGSSVECDYGSPANWWQHWNGGVDFTKVNEFQSVGPCMYSLVPGAKGGLYPTAWGGDDAAWALRDNWFPCTIRIIIVAVSSGSTFSGWDNYLNGGGGGGGGCTPYHQATPNYSYDQANGRTNKVVPSTDEYSYNSDMSGAVSGTGDYLSLTPGQDVYFRTKKVDDCILESAIQHLVVPAECTPYHQATPNYSINFSYERTNKVIPSTDEYSYNADMSGAISGTGAYLYLTPGQDVYFRTKKVDDCVLESSVQHLVVPPRTAATPSYTIDYLNERTNEAVSSTVAYSTSPLYTSPVSGTGEKITLTPGQDLYFWVKETSSTFASLTFHLAVPNRPATPSVTLDYMNEVTSSVSSSLEWSENSNMSAATSGANAALPVTPGTDLYFRVKATASGFESAVQSLTVPDRPDTPTYQIDYDAEKTSTAVPSADEYSLHSDMTGSTSGDGAALILTPGTDLYFRTKATASSFRSGIQHLVVGPRPAAPSFSIDYANETTAEAVESTVEHAATPDMASATAGTGTALPLTPGSDVYFRIKSTASSFASENYHLNVPEKPVLSYTGNDTVTSQTITMQAILDAGMTGFELTDLTVTNGHAQNLQANNTFDIIAGDKGNVTVVIQHNALGGASFASNIVTVYYNKIATSIDDLTGSKFKIYPNPSKAGYIYIKSAKILPYTIKIYSVDGNMVKSVESFEGMLQQINMQELPKGNYFLRITTIDSTIVEKIVLE